MSRIFTDQELKELSKSLPQQAMEALKAGEIAKLGHLLLRMSAAHTALHFLGVATITRIWDKWHLEYGEKKTQSMLDRIGRLAMETFIKQFQEGKEKETITDIIDIYKHQAGAAFYEPFADAGPGLLPTSRLSDCPKYPKYPRSIRGGVLIYVQTVYRCSILRTVRPAPTKIYQDLPKFT